LRQQQAAEAAERRRQYELDQQRWKAAQRQQAAQTQLASEKGVDYTRLSQLLQAGQWKEADQETADRMCEIMGRQKERWLRVDDIQNFPCTDLRTINQLWVTHSQGKFGFSVQTKIWQECGSPTEYNSDWEKFGETVGWKKRGWCGYSDMTFDTSAPKGHLPLGWCRGGELIHEIENEENGLAWIGLGFEYLWISSLSSRVVNCSIK
jgi:hypothetical protein